MRHRLMLLVCVLLAMTYVDLRIASGPRWSPLDILIKPAGATVYNGKGMMFDVLAASFNPADSTAYCIYGSSQAPDTACDLYATVILKAAVLKAASIRVVVAGTLGTGGQNGTLEIWKNNTAAVGVSAAVAHSATTQTVTNTAINDANGTFAVGDRFVPRITHPVWTTEPTTVVYRVQTYFEVP